MTIVSLLRLISTEKLTCDRATPLIQELATHSILLDDSMLSREVGYSGFGSVRVFLDSMFGDQFILCNYKPYQKLAMYHGPLSESIAERMGSAARVSWKAGIEEPQARCLWGVAEMLISTSLHIRLEDRREPETGASYWSLFRAVEEIIEETRAYLSAMESRWRRYLYAEAGETSQHDNIAGLAAHLAFEVLGHFSIEFRGYEDRRWHSAHKLFTAAFPRFGGETAGLDPFQQRLALEMVQAARRNMEGHSETITRLFLSVSGPYRNTGMGEETAYGIVEDAMFFEIGKLRDLHARAPDEVAPLLPPNVEYDPLRDTLIHTYRSGTPRETDLSSLALRPIDLSDQWIRLPTDREVSISEWSDPVC